MSIRILSHSVFDDVKLSHLHGRHYTFKPLLLLRLSTLRRLRLELLANVGSELELTVVFLVVRLGQRLPVTGIKTNNIYKIEKKIGTR